ncbi:MAG: formylglycine-generating enzyme family protein, partial [Ktedonobacterales bacterium]
PLPAVPARLASLGFRGVNLGSGQAITPPLVSVAAGRFQMGSDKSRDAKAFDDETPEHRVEVAAFQIGKYPVTVAEYALAERAGAVREPPKVLDVTWQTQLQRLDHQVVCVSWQDAMAYVKWLRAATGEPGWRLPSEAEWEKAARWDVRANASHLYPWGDSFDQARCNTLESGIGHTTPVGWYGPDDPDPRSGRHSGASPWGAEEMAGNVREWTSSLYKPYPYSESDGREAPDSTENRTLRGGSWNDSARFARAAYRGYYRSDILYTDYGFRLALSRVVAGS